MDVYWAVMGQQDPIEWLKKYPNRIKVLHIKDRAILGESGMMNFENIFRQAYANGIKDYFVELDASSVMSVFVRKAAIPIKGYSPLISSVIS